MDNVTDKNKEISAAATAGPNNFVGMSVSMPGGTGVGVQGIGPDPINALQNLTKQPVPAGMVQSGDDFEFYVV